MDVDGLSSPVAPPLSLPASTLGDAPTGREPRRTNALTLNEDEDDQGEDAAAARKRRRPRPQQNGEIPIVQDVVGQSVAENFEKFLKTYVGTIFRWWAVVSHDSPLGIQMGLTLPRLPRRMEIYPSYLKGS